MTKLKDTIRKLRDYLLPKYSSSDWFYAKTKEDRILLQLLYILEEHYYGK